MTEVKTNLTRKYSLSLSFLAWLSFSIRLSSFIDVVDEVDVYFVINEKYRI